MELKSKNSTSTRLLLLGFFVVAGSYGLMAQIITVAHDTGSSMEPTIPPSSLVVVEHYDKNFGVGSIVAYGPPCSLVGVTIVHRIVGTSNGTFITKGDNNALTDQAAGVATPVVPSCIVGRVIGWVPLP